ncbi:type II toxin-antitoxin system RelE family toxin [Acinetobacter sp. Ver3]
MYNVKLRSAVYRLVYQVTDAKIVVLVLDLDRLDTTYKKL